MPRNRRPRGERETLPPIINQNKLQSMNGRETIWRLHLRLQKSPFRLKECYFCHYKWSPREVMFPAILVLLRKWIKPWTTPSKMNERTDPRHWGAGQLRINVYSMLGKPNHNQKTKMKRWETPVQNYTALETTKCWSGDQSCAIGQKTPHAHAREVSTSSKTEGCCKQPIDLNVYGKRQSE